MMHCSPQSSGSAGDHSPRGLTRRRFVQSLSATALGASTFSAAALSAFRAPKLQAETDPVLFPNQQSFAEPDGAENLVQKLFESMTAEQKEEVCFPWDHKDDRGLLRLHVANNWQITDPTVVSEFYTKDQQALIEAIFWKLYNPDWKARIEQQLRDDAEGYGQHQSIALFGEPGSGQFEFVMTGRHLTIRCDGDSTAHYAFGGPIFYGHAANEMFNEPADHPDNVFWHQSLKANSLYQMLDGKQRTAALVANGVPESRVNFGAVQPGPLGLHCQELSSDQRVHLEQVLESLVAPYRSADQAEVRRCLDSHGGIANCHLSFFADGDLGADGVWDNWRLEGPSFVWHYRGNPHVHVWVNVADDPSQRITTRG